MDDTTPLLLIVALIVLPFGWLAYRGERDRHHRHVLDLMRYRPCGSEALLSATTAAADRLHAALQQLERMPHCAVHQAAEATRRKHAEPAQRAPEKPARQRQPQAKGHRG